MRALCLLAITLIAGFAADNSALAQVDPDQDILVTFRNEGARSVNGGILWGLTLQWLIT